MDYSNTESLDSMGKRKSLGRVMNRFAEKTSMQGVGYINSAKLPGAKVVWVILLLGAVGAMGFHLFYLCSQYFSRPVATKVSLGFDNLEMPAVTVCNVNPVRRSKLKFLSPEMKELVDAINPKNLKVEPRLPPATDPPKPMTTTEGITKRKKRFVGEYKSLNLSAYDKEDDDDEDDEDDEDEEGEINSIQALEDAFRSIYMDQEREDRVDAGHTMEDMLLLCSFDKRNCYEDNFTLYQSPDFGNCYTLEPTKYVMKTAGPQFGLVLIMYLQNNEYIRGITQGNGVRVAIHDKNTIPFPSDEGLFASASFETNIGLKLIEIQRLGGLYGSCTDGVEFKRLFNKEYSRHACKTTCEQRTILDVCKCFHEELAEIFQIGNIKNVRPCRSKQERQCMKVLAKKFRNKSMTCKCENPCSEKAYQLTVSSRQWPTEDYSSVVLQSICQDSERAELCEELLKADKRTLSLNFLKLVIYYESLNYEKVVETPEIEDAQFLSDVGGALGLWIGLSVLSIFELFQLLVEMCDYSCQKCRKDEDKARQKKAREANRQLQEQQRRNSRYGEVTHSGIGLYEKPSNLGRRRSSTYDDISVRDGFNTDFGPNPKENFNRWNFDKDFSSYQIYRGQNS